MNATFRIDKLLQSKGSILEHLNLTSAVKPDHFDFIDGLRALAVLLVIMFHFNLLLLDNGFLGVDVFFVISGFVITEMVRRLREIEEYSIEKFWRRRILRIIPALYVTTTITLFISSFIYLPDDFNNNVRSAQTSLLLFSNIHFYFLTDYFSENQSYWLFLHHWSLSVEEQYYILFPLFIAGVYRYWSLRFYLLGALLAVTLICYLWLYQRTTMGAFYLLPARGWEFLIGSAVAFLPRHMLLSRLQADSLSGAGLLMIAVAAFGVLPVIPFGQLDLLCTVFGTGLVIFGCLFGPRTFVRAALSLRPVRFIGLISFSLYLVHWPIFVVAQYVAVEPLSLTARLALLLPTYFIAWTNWRTIEVPFRGLGIDRTLGGARLWLMLAMSTALLLGVFSLVLAGNLKAPATSSAVQVALDGRLDINRKRSRCHSNEDNHPVDPAKACRIGAPSKPSTAVWSDSHGAELAEALGKVAALKNNSILQLSSSSCPPVLALHFSTTLRCQRRNETVLQFLKKRSEIETVVLAMRYDGYPEHADSRLLAGLRRASKALAVAGKRVIIVAPFPRPGFNVPHGRARAIYLNREISEGISADTHRRANAKINRALQQISSETGATIFDPAQVMCTPFICSFFANERPLYFDDNHPSVFGASKVAEKLILLM